MRKAVIKADDFASKKATRTLVRELYEEGFDVVVIHKFEDLNSVYDKQWLKEPVVYFRNPYIRIPDPGMIYDWYLQNRNFNYIVSKDGEIIALTFEKVLKQDFSDFDFKPGIFPFFTTRSTSLRKPDVEAPLIISYTHNRQQYLELTLNSLTHSIGEEFKNQPMVIVLNDPTAAIEKSVNYFVSQHPHVEVFKAKRNSKYTAVNLVAQVYKPKNLVVFEDDFILPPATNRLYPNWPLLFAEKLDTFDFVAWHRTETNEPASSFVPTKSEFRSTIVKIPLNSVEKAVSEGLWEASWENDSKPGGQALCTSLDFYKLCAKHRDNFTPVDATLQKYASSYLVPTLKGYHIGFNQVQDGFNSFFDPSRADVNNLENALINKKTQETFELNLKNILD